MTMASEDSRVHLAELSRHNDLPSESELQDAFQLRSNLQEVLIQVDTEIKRLKERRADIQKSIDTYNHVLSPARRLPPDILREIFYHCLPDDHNPTMSAKEAPVLLTRVCSTWRAIALTSPPIWARLHISLPVNPSLFPGFGVLLSPTAIAKRYQVFSKVMELRCRVVKDWLTRSGTCPLSISLSTPFRSKERVDDSVDAREAYEATEALFQQILSFSPRWKDVELSMPLFFYKKLESHISGDDLPLLNSLRGNIQRNHEDSEGADPFPGRFLAAPNLQRLSFHSAKLTHNPMFLHTWSRLTDLHIQETIQDTDFFNIIKLCRNLITCQVDYLDTNWGEESPQEVLIPTLQMIRINQKSGVSDVVHAINAPNLKSLDYRSPARLLDHESEEPAMIGRADALLALVERGASTLRKLTLVPEFLRPEDTLTCLRLANGISHLVLRYGYYSYDPIEQDALGSDSFDLHLLTVHIDSGSRAILLPKLEVLEVDDIRQFTDEDLLSLLTSRMDAARRGYVSPLRHLKLQFARQRQRDIREEACQRAQSSGFELNLELDYAPDSLLFNGWLAPSYGIPSRRCLGEIWPPVIM
ncbi:hypothetical protein M413DRAFT_394032, partial [Hebeloma cylindrosporum]